MGLFDFSFSDPQSMYPLMGLLQGLGQAAQPSRLPVPFGSVLGQAASGLMQGQQAQQQFKDNQLDTQSKQQTIDFNKFKMAQQKAQINAGRKLVGLPELTDDDFSKGNFNTPMGAPAPQAPMPQATAPAPAVPQQAAPQPAANNLDSFYANFIAPHEGGYNPNDGNGKPVNFGINQGANPDIDVKNLTPEKAKQIYQERYFGPSGATAAQGPMQAVLADTAINLGTAVAKDLLAQSGGDPQKYLDLRDARYNQIAQANPQKAQYLPGWLKRTQDLRQYIAQNGQQPEQGAQAPVPAAAPVATPQAAAAPSGGLEIPPELRANPVFQLAAASGDMETISKMLEAHQTRMTPEELAANHMNPDTIAYKTMDGTIKVGVPSKLQTPEQIAQTLEIERKKAGITENDPKNLYGGPQTVEAADPKNPGQRTQFLAQQNKQTGQWVTGDQTHTPLTDVMLPGGVPGGGRAAAQVGRMIGAAKDVATGLTNIAALPLSSSTGFLGLLGGKQDVPGLFGATKTVLANQMTSQEVQTTKAMYVGIAKAIGTLDAGGLQSSDTFLKQISQLEPAEGDTYGTKMLKLAELRQQADNALEAQLNGPLLSSQQKVYAKQLRADLEKAIPWKPLDVVHLLQSKNPQATISDYAKGVGLAKPQGASVPQPSNQSQKAMLPHPKSPAEADKLKPGTHFIAPDGRELVR